MCSSITERSAPVIGFCFSFPVEQSSVNSGKLLRWTKGYNNPGAIGSDPAKLLTDAFKRRVCFLLHSKDYSAYTDLQELALPDNHNGCPDAVTLCSSSPGILAQWLYIVGDTMCSSRKMTTSYMVQGIHVNVGALLNDTVGVLAAVRYIDGTDTIASVIMGTGKPSNS